jgi:hypothetical protein
MLYIGTPEALELSSTADLTIEGGPRVLDLARDPVFCCT